MAALWTGIRLHLLKDWEMMLQKDFGARSKRVVTFLIPAVLRDIISFLSHSPRPQLLAQQGHLIPPSNPRKTAVQNGFILQHALLVRTGGIRLLEASWGL